MTDNLFATIWADAQKTTDPDAFASDWATSSEFLPADPEQEIDLSLFGQLLDLWHVANDPFRELLDRLGKTQSSCARRFCIPLRTVQGWALGERECPSYIRLMMAEATGTITLRDYERRPHMDMTEFMAGVFDSAIDCGPMTYEQAVEDLKNYERDGWTMPEDITPERYMEAWNELYDKS